jgi:hypothetical protein
VRAEIEAIALAELGDGAAAEVLALLEYRHRAAAAREINRRGKAGETPSDNDDIPGHGRAGMVQHCFRLWQNPSGFAVSPSSE